MDGHQTADDEGAKYDHQCQGVFFKIVHSGNSLSIPALRKIRQLGFGPDRH
jgi:hypothetical protein